MNRIFAVVIRHWLPLLSLNTVLLIATSFIASKTPKVWTANAELILPNTTSDLNANLGTLGNLSGGGVVFSQQINPLKILSSILLSNETLMEAYKSDPEKELYSSLNSYRGIFKVSPQGETTVISLSADGSSQEISQKRLQTFINAFQLRLNQLRAENASGRAEFLEKQLNSARYNLQQKQMELADFKRFANLASSEDQTRELVASINTLTTSQAQVLAEVQANQAQVKMLSARLGLMPDQAVRSLRLKEKREYQFIREKLSEVEAELIPIQNLYTNEHPQVKHLLEERDELRRQMENYIAEAAGGTSGLKTSIGDDSALLIQQLVLAESQVSAQKQRASQLESQIEKLNQKLRSLPAAQSRLLDLQRQCNIAEGVYNGLVAKVQEAKLNTFSSYPNVQTLTQPNVDPKPSGSKKKVIVLGGLLASGFGSIALLLLLESRNPLLSLAYLREIDIPLLGSIPRHKHQRVKISRQSETPIEFQRLASAISMMHLDNHRLMISSTTKSEGKTSVILGLANALVTLGFRILIVDGDFRSCELSRRLGYSPEPKEMSGSPFVPIRIHPKMDLVPSTPKGDEMIQFIASGKFEQFLNIAQSGGNYDYVLIDSPPIDLTSEAALMAKAVRNVLLVTWLGVSKQHPFQNSIEQLLRHKARVVGLVINGDQIGYEGYYGHSEAKVSL